MYPVLYPIGSMNAIYGNMYHQYTPNVSIYTIHGSYGYLTILNIILSKCRENHTWDTGGSAEVDFSYVERSLRSHSRDESDSA